MAEGMQLEEIAPSKREVGVMWLASNVVASKASSLSSRGTDYMVSYVSSLTDSACFPIGTCVAVSRCMFDIEGNHTTCNRVMRAVKVAR